MEVKKTSPASRLTQILRKVLIRLLVIGFGLVIAFLGFELVLRISPNIFNYKIQNLAFGKYDNLPNGIYRWEPISRMNFMKPNFQTRIFFNGYWWTHSTDAHGFRNPADLQSYDIALLGDSVIYGHGVNEEQTLGSFLRKKYNYNAYNMARQGDGLFNYYVLLRMYMSKLKIKTVLIFGFINDFQDTETYRRGVINQRPEINSFNYEKIYNNLQLLMNSKQSFFGKLVFNLYSVRLLSKFFRQFYRERRRKKITESWKHKQNQKPSQEKVGATNQVSHVYSAGFIPKLFASSKNSTEAILSKTTLQNKVPSEKNKKKPKNQKKAPYFIDLILDSARFNIVAEYYDAILADLKQRCKNQGVRLVFINLYLPKPLRPKIYHIACKKLRDRLKLICNRYDIEFFDTGKAFKGKQGCYLEHDGHLTEKGHRILSKFIHKQVLGPKSGSHQNRSK